MLRFTAYAWAKLHYLCHLGETEIGGFGLSHVEDPLLVIDFLTLRQSTSAATVEFDDEAVADLFETQVSQGQRPEQFARIWCHTHPGSSACPSNTDEETFRRVFGRCDWAVMFILARGGETSCRLRFNVGPGGDGQIETAVDYAQPFEAADHQAWTEEYQNHIQPVHEGLALMPESSLYGWGSDADDFDPDDFDEDPARLQMQQLMEEYGVSEVSDLEAMLQREMEEAE